MEEVKLIQQQLQQLDHQFGTTAAQCPIEISARFKRTLGQYCYEPATQRRWFRFQAGITQSVAVWREVVIHEFIHYYLESERGITGHGAAFRQLCRELGIRDRATLAITPTQRARYQCFCRTCGQLVGERHRLTAQFQRRLRQSVCRNCRGPIVIVDTSQATHRPKSLR